MTRPLIYTNQTPFHTSNKINIFIITMQQMTLKTLPGPQLYSLTPGYSVWQIKVKTKLGLVLQR